MTDLKNKFDNVFKVYYPATFEAAERFEPKAHRDMLNAWWGFQQGYGCALPTTEPAHPKSKLSALWPLLNIAAMISAFSIGYQFPRDVEIESTKPVVLTYEITPEAQKTLLLRSVEGFPKCEMGEAR